MKVLYIVRHAKSSWSFDVSDHERPLLPEGINRTKKVIGYLKKQKVFPERIVSSSALRARATSELIAKGLNYPEDQIDIETVIYRADGESIFEYIKSFSDDYQSVMIVGHNPTLSDLANYFLIPPTDGLPTSAIVGLQFDIESWKDIKKGNSVIKFVIFPKLI